MSESSRRDFMKTVAWSTGGIGLATLAACTPSTSGTTAGTAGAAASGASNATGRLAQILNRGKLRVGVTLTIPPFGFQDSGGNPTGFDIDVAKILGKALYGADNKVQFVEQAMDARLPNLITGKTDISIQLTTVTAARAQTVEFCIPYYRDGNTTLMPANSRYSSALDMRGHNVKLSILQNSFAEDFAKQGVPDAQVLQFPAVADAILAVDTGRADAYVGGFGEINYFNTNHVGKYKVGTYGWLAQTYSAAIAPGDQRFLNWCNTAFHEMLVGVDWTAYQAAYKKYFSVQLTDPPVGFPIEFGLRTSH